ncbi:hypothetical protein GTQ34_08250 [Muricauda sp. JGD-17]|uniref:Uncharacterized protein n=1 Tax=Flagellimonas ochracea TaxID=2696472 RepID=A0A964TEB5_9FLAO|nr:hypothetical protein [Allomuricauda ochracea]NAY91906.1 hypothetical protein [Allomuricauda ochracea]
MKNGQSNEIRLREILEIERRRKSNLVMGVGFGGIGLLMITGGVELASQKYYDERYRKYVTNPFGQIMGGLIAALGAIDMGISAPLFVSSIKNKRKRDNKILELSDPQL